MSVEINKSNKFVAKQLQTILDILNNVGLDLCRDCKHSSEISDVLARIEVLMDLLEEDN